MYVAEQFRFLVEDKKKKEQEFLTSYEEALKEWYGEEETGMEKLSFEEMIREFEQAEADNKSLMLIDGDLNEYFANEHIDLIIETYEDCKGRFRYCKKLKEEDALYIFFDGQTETEIYFLQ